MSNGRSGLHHPPASGRAHSQRRGGGGRRNGGSTIHFEIPRRAAPGYLTAILGDHHTLQCREAWKDVPPGHRFQLYFHGVADMSQIEKPDDKGLHKRLNVAADQGDWDTLSRNGAHPSGAWLPLKKQKRVALKAAAAMGKAGDELLSAIAARSNALRHTDEWRREAELIAPLATGLGNPHPVENGFAFVSPYGVPYLAGSGVKGVLRRAAEELALFEGDSRWSLAEVWAIFGFDGNSACFKDDEDAPGWRHAYSAWMEQVHDRGNAVLDAWLTGIRKQLPRESRNLAPAQFLESLATSRDIRRAIHWQGLLAVQDAFPPKGATMAVDILNPHHKNYYEGKIENGRQATPHDAENPVPVFFLTVAPGARFTFSTRPLRGREGLWQAIGNWQELLDAAFDYAGDWSGFGAKTAVGYGQLDRTGPLGQPSAKAAAASQSAPQRWDSVTVTWNPGSQELRAQNDDQLANVQGQDAQRLVASLSDEDRNRLKKKKKLILAVQVEYVGGKLWKITGFG